MSLPGSSRPGRVSSRVPAFAAPAGRGHARLQVASGSVAGVQDNGLIYSKPNEMTVASRQRAKHPSAPEFLGIYPAHRVGALAGVSGYTIGQWARNKLIRPTYYEGRPANLYAFNDAAEAIVVHWLLKRGFTYEEIHAAVDHARESYPDWPLITAPIGVAQHAVEGDPRGMIVERADDGAFVDTGRAGRQTALKPELLSDVALMLRRGGWIADELHLKRIEVDPQKLGGAPTLRGRRWGVEGVAQIAADAEGRAILINDYGLDDRDVDEAVSWTEAAASLA